MNPQQQISSAPARPALLFLCHRIPFPPDKGDKIRSFNLLKFLSGHFRIYLATFIDDPRDARHLEALQGYCADLHVQKLRPRAATLRSGVALLTGEALSLRYYHSSGLRRWVENVVARERIERALVFSSVMGQFLPGALRRRGHVVDFVDVDSDKWLQYAASKRWPLSWLYRREARTLLQWERELAATADISLFVSQAEAAMFREQCPQAAARIGHFDNGVDDGYFTPAAAGASPYATGTQALVFTGAMDYWPNADAVTHFARDIFPRLRGEHPQLEFWIVGGNPTPAVKALAGSGITVTGRVDDVRPYIGHALAAVAPLRIARGVQNKVLEAMAMEKPVLVSRKGLEGIGAHHGEELMICENAEDYRAALQSLDANAVSRMGKAARAYVHRRANWSANLTPLLQHLDATPEPPRVGEC